MNTHLKFVFACCFCAWLCACKKDKQELPAITNRGANTFGCLVNGEPVIFSNPKQFIGGFKYSFDSTGQLLPIDSNDIWLGFDNGKHTISLFVNNPYFNNYWKLNQNTLLYPSELKPKDYIMIDGFTSSEGTSGWIRSINFRETYPIFSGTFEFECINPRTCQTMKVTNGRLDINLHDID